MSDRNDKSNVTGTAFMDASKQWLDELNFSNIRRPDRHPCGALFDLEAVDMSGVYCLIECKGSSIESTKNAGERTDNHQKFLGEYGQLSAYYKTKPTEVKPRILYLLSHPIPRALPTQWAETFDRYQLWGEFEVYVVPFTFSTEAAA